MTAPAPADPRFRPFRGLAWALYLVVAVGYSCLVIFSVTKSVLAMSPGRPEGGATLPVEACAGRLAELFSEVERERQALERVDSATADARWLTFRNEWMVRARQLESICAVEEPSRAGLKATFAALHAVMDHATVSATQLSGQLGPALDAFRAQHAKLPH